MNAFDLLFEEYVLELRAAISAANDWWEELNKRASENASSGQEGPKFIEARWPFGPNSHPFVLAVFRKFYLSVVKINEELQTRGHSPTDTQPSEGDWGSHDDGGEQRFDGGVPLAPWVFLIDALHGDNEDLVDAIVWLVYQPVGLDENDQVV